jgi:serine/threonine protein kinase
MSQGIAVFRHCYRLGFLGALPARAHYSIVRFHPQSIQDGLYAADQNLLKRASADLLRSVAYLHARRISHDDIKAANILVARSAGTSMHAVHKLTDFGLARPMSCPSYTMTSGLQKRRGCGTSLRRLMWHVLAGPQNFSFSYVRHQFVAIHCCGCMISIALSIMHLQITATRRCDAG